MNAYLASHKSTGEHTHTRIPDQESNIYGGSYCINDLETFFAIYYKHVFEQKNKEYLTEKQLECGPIAIDLDFRYDEAKRQYDHEHISYLVEFIYDELYKLFSIQQNFPIYVFEKPNINVLPDKIKDGIHIIVGLNLDTACKTLLRTRLLKMVLDMKLTNSMDTVLDEGVLKGTTAWQLYGSRKPNCDPYHLTHIYDCGDNIHQLPVDEFNMKDDLYKLSIRNTNHETPVLKDEFKMEYDNMKQKRKSKIISKPVTSEITNPVSLNHAIEKLFSSLTLSEYKLEEIHQYVLCLPASYYDDYSKWIRVGWALRNTDNRLFLTWVKFSSLSDKFSYGDIPKLKSDWNSWHESNEEMLTMRSIMYWARIDNRVEYEKIREKSIDIALDEAIKDQCTEFDIASILYQCHKDKFVCVDIKSSRWFQFTNHRWIETDSGTELRKKITDQKDLYGIFAKKCSQLSVLKGLISPDDPELKKKCESNDAKQRKLTNIMSNMLKKQGDKIMREACHKFYVQNFLQLLDSKNHILCFTNGVIDFTMKTFRDGLPEDYTHKCTNIPYVPKSQLKTSMVNEVATFMEQLFPDEELCEYMYDHAASILTGLNKNQKFTIYIGSGRNGKSKFVELMSLALGDYKATVPVSLITKPRSLIGGATPEVAALLGVRYAVMQESSVNDSINEGPMKELTGGDKLQCRALYKDSITFTPQFKLVMPTNNLPKIEGRDEGTWRRIAACEFKSEFVENPDPNSKYQFKIDKNLDTKFPSWANVFMSLLVDRAFITEGKLNPCAMVDKHSNEYRQGQDHLATFIAECIESHPSGMILDTQLLERCKEWWMLNYNKKVPAGSELFSYVKKAYPSSKKGSAFYGIRLIRPDFTEVVSDNI